MDYTYLYKKKYDSCEDLKKITPVDIFISCYSDSDRVVDVFNCINSTKKIWVVLPDYSHKSEGLKNTGDVYEVRDKDDEAKCIGDLFDYLKLSGKENINVDITGFFIPHLLYLLKHFKARGFTRIEFLYSEPNYYAKREKTTFSKDFHFIRQIHGYEGLHTTDTSNDLLVIASGYDNARITDVANEKANTSKVQLFGFPSLKPDMYQENIIKSYNAEAAIGGNSFIDLDVNIYAPAYDPFVAAQKVKMFIEKSVKKYTNVYLCPISTKAHALGLGLLYLWECEGTPTSIIYPFCEVHYNNTTKGIGKIHIYSVEYPPSK